MDEAGLSIAILKDKPGERPQQKKSQKKAYFITIK